MRFLCRLAWHDWGAWETGILAGTKIVGLQGERITEVPSGLWGRQVPYIVHIQTRRCRGCGREQRRNL